MLMHWSNPSGQSTAHWGHTRVVPVVVLAPELELRGAYWQRDLVYVFCDVVSTHRLPARSVVSVVPRPSSGDSLAFFETSCPVSCSQPHRETRSLVYLLREHLLVSDAAYSGYVWAIVGLEAQLPLVLAHALEVTVCIVDAQSMHSI